MKKTICALLCCVLLWSALPLTVFADSYVTTLSPSSGNMTMMKADEVYAAQFHTTAGADTIGIYATSYGDNKGSLTVGLYRFQNDYLTSFHNEPIAQQTFTDFGDNQWLSLTAADTIPAGEYILAVYYPTASSTGGSDVGVQIGTADEAQLFYHNHKIEEDKTLILQVSYPSQPNKTYELPTQPQVVEGDIDYAPDMNAVLDFSKEENVSRFIGGANAVSSSYNEKGYLTLAVKEHGDPYQYLNVSAAGSMSLDEYPVVLMKVRRPYGSPTTGQLFFATETAGIAEANSFRFSYQDTTDWQYLIFDLSENQNGQGFLKTLRYDVFLSADDDYNVDVAYIAFFTATEAAEAFDDNFSQYETTPGGSEDDNGEVPGETVNWTIDGTKTVREYVTQAGWGFINLKNAEISDGVLRNAPFASFSLYNRYLAGDDYGYNDSILSFDLEMTSGSLDLGLRLVKPEDTVSTSGLWMSIFANGDILLAENNGLQAAVQTGVAFSQKRRVVITDAHESMTVTVDGKLALTLSYDLGDRSYSVADGNGNILLADTDCGNLPYTGYFKFVTHGIVGYMDNITYNRTKLVQETVVQNHLTDYSTWVATDDLDRTTPTGTATKTDKYVGIFYFMNHSDDMSGRHLEDTTAYYLTQGLDGLKAMLTSRAGRSGIFWSEPYYGYYTSNDEYVYRKHAAMLSAAGVDFIFIDNSNDVFYLEQTTILMDTWAQIRAEGGNTPQIVFAYGDMPTTLLDALAKMMDPILCNEKYADLLFQWEGKPLLLGNYDTPKSKTWTVTTGSTPQTKAQFLNRMKNDPVLKEFYESGAYAEALTKFTIRKSWAWQANQHNGYWDWLQESPQAFGTNADGTAEQMAVALGMHAHTNRGRSFVNNITGYDTGNDFGFSLGTARYGYLFAEQFEYALEKDPQVIMITGWNEWYAGIQTAGAAQVTGSTATPGYTLIDQFTPEYSRDAEPMRIRDAAGSVGYGDNYYYQMVTYIRRFKGASLAPETTNGGAIDLYAADVDAQWSNISPMFTDTVNDIAYRSDYSFASVYLYANATGQNDIDFAKISQDADNVYFYVTTANSMVVADDAQWMNLFINTDNNTATGWEGFDFVINRSRSDSTMAVEKFNGETWETISVGSATYVKGTNSLTVKVAKSVLGLKSGEAVGFTFKWADNSTNDGDVMEFMEIGDAAPDNRFAFLYLAPKTLSNEAATEPPATNPPATEAVEKTGCGSVYLSAVAGVAILLAGACLCKKKK